VRRSRRRGGVRRRPTGSARSCCARELDEELGWTGELGRLLVVDWLPDLGGRGDRILFTSNQDGPASVSANLYTVRPDGSGLTQLTHARGGSVQYLSASFSPDGDWITAARTPGTGKAGNADVFVMRADGTDLRRVTRSEAWDSSTDWGQR